MIGNLIELNHKYDRAVRVVNECVSRNTSILASASVSNNIYEEFYNFEMPQYNMSHPSNPVNHLNQRTVLCSIRPFGHWYKHLFGDRITTKLAYNHIIAIKKEHILRNSKQFYENLMRFVDHIDEGKQPEVVHYFERSWEAIFYPLEEINFIHN